LVGGPALPCGRICLYTLRFFIPRCALFTTRTHADSDSAGGATRRIPPVRTVHLPFCCPPYRFTQCPDVVRACSPCTVPCLLHTSSHYRITVALTVARLLHRVTAGHRRGFLVYATYSRLGWIAQYWFDPRCHARFWFIRSTGSSVPFRLSQQRSRFASTRARRFAAGCRC